jgi:hypothetical protein
MQKLIASQAPSAKPHPSLPSHRPPPPPQAALGAQDQDFLGVPGLVGRALQSQVPQPVLAIRALLVVGEAPGLGLGALLLLPALALLLLLLASCSPGGWPLGH